ncbi:MAG: germination protein YpeB, partial [Clostridia bacterium]|nr:germination protein YpeB [Clostridia bacterium]
AKKYLNKTLGLQFKESYYIVNENVATINFAFFENGVTFYSDLIKVGVDLEDGDIVSLEARGFVMNHHNREKYTYKHTKSQAEKTINSELKIKTVNKAVALDDAQNEIYCFEFHCKTETGEDIIVYVKDKDLSEQDIFMIIHTDGGDLVL